MAYKPKQDPHTGLLHLRNPASSPGYWRYHPSPELAPYIEHHWTVEWDLAGPVLRETLPYPCANLVLEPGRAELAGVQTKKFSRTLSGRGRVLGTKFRAGGLRAFIDAPVSGFTDRVLPLDEVFGPAARDLDSRALIHEDHHAAIAVLEGFLLGLGPSHDPDIGLAGEVVARIAEDRELKSVEELAATFDVSKRRLQRLFVDYVGTSPKWVIRRYRLQEAAEVMAAAETIDWPQLAADLGYADQAHFIREFKRLVGKTPADYRRKLSN